MAQQQFQRLTRAKELAQIAELKLHEEGEVPCPALMAEKLSPGINGKKGINLNSNIYGCLMNKLKAYRYEVRIFGVNEGGREIDLTVGPRDDIFKVEQKRRCLIVFGTFFSTNSGLFGQRRYAYDMSRILFTSVPLNGIQQQQAQISASFTIQHILALDIFPHHFVQQYLDNFQRVSIELAAAAGQKFEVELSDIQTAISRNMEEYNRTLLQYIDVNTAQWAMINPEEHVVFSSNETYLVNPQQYGYTVTELPYFRSINAYPAAGARKDACFVEGPKGYGGEDQINCVPAIVISSKKTPFHDHDPNPSNIRGNLAPGNLLVKARFHSSHVGDIRLDNGTVFHLEVALKGLYVETTYTHRRFKIVRLTKTTAHDTFFVHEGVQKSVVDYFQEEHNITLRFPLAPLIVNPSGNSYPMELCIISENQKVKMEHQTSDFSREMIRICAVEPAKLIEHNERTVNSLHLDNSPILEDASINFVRTPLIMENARVLSPPKIIYQNNDIREVREGTDNTWTPGKRLLHPCTCQTFVVLAQSDRPSERSVTDVGAFQQFMKMFSDEARRNGMQIQAPEIITLPSGRSSNEEALSISAQFSQLTIREPKPEFVLLVQLREDEIVHDTVKLQERLHGIVTQTICWSTVINVARKTQRVTLQNILYKTNIKLLGLNYSLASDEISDKLLSKRLLIIGIGVSHFIRQPSDLEAVENTNDNTNQLATNGNGSVGANGTANGHGIRNGENGPPTTAENGNGNGAQTSGIRPQQQPRASIVGFSANIGEKAEHFEFIGDFMIQEPHRMEKSDAVFQIVDYCVEKFIKNRKNTPSRVIIYRHGTSEGDYARILKYEAAFIKLALKKYHCDDAKLHIIACNKLHNVRFFRSDINPRTSAKEQNIRPGTVIDSQAVHPTRSEFYLNAHMALQGTARTPRFTILLNESGPSMTMDIFEGITNYLCYGHQIVNSPTSFPSPLFIANLYADRGRRVYARRLLTGDNNIANLTNEQLEADLCYRYSPELANRRINA